MNNQHYMCTGGCRGVSDKPGACQAVDCPKHGEPLTRCGCKDGKHGGASEKERQGKPRS